VFNAGAAFLLAEDIEVLRGTTEAMGKRFRHLVLAEARRFIAGRDDVLFIGSRADGRAAALLSTLPAATVARSIIVARTDSLSDLRSCLQMGAGDFVVSPLAAHQVAGAFDRIAGGPPVRDESTGLPLVAPGEPRFGLAAHLVQIELTPAADMLAVAWLLRRFLRGYDAVGVGESGELRAVIYCGPERVPAVLRRLAKLLPAGIGVTAGDTTLSCQPAVDGEPALADAA
jgi:hypothetical protein